MPESRLWLVNHLGTVFTLGTSQQKFSQLENTFHDSVSVKRLSASHWCAWAIGHDHRVYVYVRSSDVPIRVPETTYENQRWLPLHGFSKRSLLKTDRYAWSNEAGTVYRPKESVRLPSAHWEWEGDWLIDENLHGDVVGIEGWQYAFDFPAVYTPEKHVNSFVRRRKWMRFRRYSSTETWARISDMEVVERTECFIDLSVGGFLMPTQPAGFLSVWAVTNNGHVYVRTNVTSDNPEGSSWQELEIAKHLGLINISVGASNLVWAVTWDGSTVVRTHVTRSNVYGSDWAVVEHPDEATKFMQVSVGKNAVWAISRDGRVWFRKGTSGDNMFWNYNSAVGTSWVEMVGKMSQVAVSSNDQVFAVDLAGSIYFRTGVTTVDLTGKTWQLLSLHEDLTVLEREGLLSEGDVCSCGDPNLTCSMHGQRRPRLSSVTTSSSSISTVTNIEESSDEFMSPLQPYQTFPIHLMEPFSDLDSPVGDQPEFVSSDREDSIYQYNMQISKDTSTISSNPYQSLTDATAIQTADIREHALMTADILKSFHLQRVALSTSQDLSVEELTSIPKQNLGVTLAPTEVVPFTNPSTAVALTTHPAVNNSIKIKESVSEKFHEMESDKFEEVTQKLSHTEMTNKLIDADVNTLHDRQSRNDLTNNIHHNSNNFCVVKKSSQVICESGQKIDLELDSEAHSHTNSDLENKFVNKYSGTQPKKLHLDLSKTANDKTLTNPDDNLPEFNVITEKLHEQNQSLASCEDLIVTTEKNFTGLVLYSLQKEKKDQAVLACGDFQVNHDHNPSKSIREDVVEESKVEKEQHNVLAKRQLDADISSLVVDLSVPLTQPSVREVTRNLSLQEENKKPVLQKKKVKESRTVIANVFSDSCDDESIVYKPKRKRREKTRAKVNGFDETDAAANIGIETGFMDDLELQPSEGQIIGTLDVSRQEVLSNNCLETDVDFVDKPESGGANVYDQHSTKVNSLPHFVETSDLEPAFQPLTVFHADYLLADAFSTDPAFGVLSHLEDAHVQPDTFHMLGTQGSRVSVTRYSKDNKHRKMAENNQDSSKIFVGDCDIMVPVVAECESPAQVAVESGGQKHLSSECETPVHVAAEYDSPIHVALECNNSEPITTACGKPSLSALGQEETQNIPSLRVIDLRCDSELSNSSTQATVSRNSETTDIDCNVEHTVPASHNNNVLNENSHTTVCHLNCLDQDIPQTENKHGIGLTNSLPETETVGLTNSFLETETVGPTNSLPETETVGLTYSLPATETTVGPTNSLPETETVGPTNSLPETETEDLYSSRSKDVASTSNTLNQVTFHSDGQTCSNGNEIESDECLYNNFSSLDSASDEIRNFVTDLIGSEDEILDKKTEAMIDGTKDVCSQGGTEKGEDVGHLENGSLGGSERKFGSQVSVNSFRSASSNLSNKARDLSEDDDVQNRSENSATPYGPLSPLPYGVATPPISLPIGTSKSPRREFKYFKTSSPVSVPSGDVIPMTSLVVAQPRLCWRWLDATSCVIEDPSSVDWLLNTSKESETRKKKTMKIPKHLREDIMKKLLDRNKMEVYRFKDIEQAVKRTTWVKKAPMQMYQYSRKSRWIACNVELEQGISNLSEGCLTVHYHHKGKQKNIQVLLSKMTCVKTSSDPNSLSVFVVYTAVTNIINQPLMLKTGSENEASEWIASLCAANAAAWNLNTPVAAGAIWSCTFTGDVFVSQTTEAVQNPAELCWGQHGGHMRLIETGPCGVTWALDFDKKPYVYNNGYGGAVNFGTNEMSDNIQQIVDYHRVFVYENQKWFPVVGWCCKGIFHHDFHWLTESGHSIAMKEEVKLPSSKCQWVGEWTVDFSTPGGVDAHGWQYSSSLYGPFYPRHHLRSSYRRRRWVRRYKITLYGPWQTAGSLGLVDLSIQVDPVSSTSDPVVMWAVGANGDVLIRNGVTADNPKGQNWTHITTYLDKPFKSVSVGGGYRVWGIAGDGSAWFRPEVSTHNPAGTCWLQVVPPPPGNSLLHQVSAGATSVWAVDTGDNLWRRENVTPIFPEGTGWELVASRVKRVSVGPRDQVWIIADASFDKKKHGAGVIYRRTGITNNKPSGTGWEMVFANGWAHVSVRGVYEVKLESSSSSLEEER